MELPPLMRRLTEDEFPGTAYALTQFLRGCLFVAAHCLLGRSYDGDPEQNHNAHLFMLGLVSLMAQWLKVFSSH